MGADRGSEGLGFRAIERVARTADFAVCVFSVAIIATAPYSIVRQPTD